MLLVHLLLLWQHQQHVSADMVSARLSWACCCILGCATTMWQI